MRSKRRRVGLIIGCACVALILSGPGYLLTLPRVADAEARVLAIVQEHQSTIDGPALPTKLADAVVAVEDRYYYSNVFVNVLYGIARAALAAVRGHGDPGGSTISQQLAKQLYPHSPGLGGTLEEFGLGIKLSLFYSKPVILNMYLNAVYYGNGYWGDAAAARGYFGVAPSELSWAQAALLAGLPQAPTLYDPVHHLRLAKQRQRIVLDQLEDNGYLTHAQAAAIYREAMGLKRNRARPQLLSHGRNPSRTRPRSPHSPDLALRTIILKGSSGA